MLFVVSLVYLVCLTQCYNLLVCYNFDEESTSDFSSCGGAGIDGSGSNIIKGEDSVNGNNALVFNGINSWVRSDYDQDFGEKLSVGSFSASIRFRSDTTYTLPMTLFQKGCVARSIYTSKPGFRVYIGEPLVELPRVIVIIGICSNSDGCSISHDIWKFSTSVEADILDDNWHDVAISVSRKIDGISSTKDSIEVNIYVDWVKVKTEVFENVEFDRSLSTPSSSLYIGSNERDQDYFGGYIESFRLYEGIPLFERSAIVLFQVWYTLEFILMFGVPVCGILILFLVLFPFFCCVCSLCGKRYSTDYVGDTEKDDSGESIYDGNSKNANSFIIGTFCIQPLRIALSFLLVLVGIGIAGACVTGIVFWLIGFIVGDMMVMLVLWIYGAAFLLVVGCCSIVCCSFCSGILIISQTKAYSSALSKPISPKSFAFFVSATYISFIACVFSIALSIVLFVFCFLATDGWLLAGFITMCVITFCFAAISFVYFVFYISWYQEWKAKHVFPKRELVSDDELQRYVDKMKGIGLDELDKNASIYIEISRKTGGHEYLLKKIEYRPKNVIDESTIKPPLNECGNRFNLISKLNYKFGEVAEAFIEEEKKRLKERYGGVINVGQKIISKFNYKIERGKLGRKKEWKINREVFDCVINNLDTQKCFSSFASFINWMSCAVLMSRKYKVSESTFDISKMVMELEKVTKEKGEGRSKSGKRIDKNKNILAKVLRAKLKEEREIINIAEDDINITIDEEKKEKEEEWKRENENLVKFLDECRCDDFISNFAKNAMIYEDLKDLEDDLVSELIPLKIPRLRFIKHLNLKIRNVGQFNNISSDPVYGETTDIINNDNSGSNFVQQTFGNDSKDENVPDISLENQLEGSSMFQPSTDDYKPSDDIQPPEF